MQNNNPADVVRNERGTLVAVYNRYQNLSELSTSGIDVELRQRWRTEAAGNFGLNTAYTHVRDYRRPTVVGGPLQDYAGSNLGPSLPRNKATTTLDWNLGTISAALTWYYTGGYDQKASAAASAVQSRVGDYNQFDLYLGYTGIDALTLYAKIENLADKQPPVDASFPGFARLTTSPNTTCAAAISRWGWITGSDSRTQRRCAWWRVATNTAIAPPPAAPSGSRPRSCDGGLPAIALND